MHSRRNSLSGSSKAQGYRSRSLMRAVVDVLEPRRLLSTSVTAAITKSTVWTTSGSPYELQANINVQQGATLTIQSGVVVTTSNGSTLTISSDNTAAKISATGVTFDAQLITNTSAGGSVKTSIFNTAPIFDSTSPSSVALSGDTFSGGVEVNPQYVSTLIGNTFTPNSTVSVLGGQSVTSNTTWGVIPNVTQYEIVSYSGSYGGKGVHVQNGATLTINPGVKVSTDGLNYGTNYDGIYVADDSSGAVLSAKGTSTSAITLAAPIYIENSGSATITDSQVGGTFYVGSPGSTGVSITGTSFSQTPTFAAPSTSGMTLTTDTFGQSVSIDPQIVSLIVTDKFGTNSTIDILGGQYITTSTAWPVIPNVSQYEIVSYSGAYGGKGVHVQNGAILAINPGVKVSTDGLNYGTNYDGIYVADDSSGASLVARGTATSGITITAPISINNTGNATITDSQVQGSFYVGTPGSSGVSITGTSFSQTPTFDAPSTSGLALTTDTFGQSVSIEPQIVSLIVTDKFATNSTIDILGGQYITTSTTWPVIPNVSQYEIVSYSGPYGGKGVHVQNGATLTINPGVKVSTDGLNYGTNYDGIYVADDASGAALIARGTATSGITLAAPIYIDTTGTAAITDSQVKSTFYVGSPGSDGVSITGTSFSQTPTFDAPSTSGLTLTTDTFGQSVSIQPQIVSVVNSDTFATNSTIDILGGQYITSDTTWSEIPNVSQYDIVSYSGAFGGKGVHVQNGATLTINPGVKVGTDGLNYGSNYDGIYVADDGSGAALDASGVTFVAPVYFTSSSNGSVQYSLFDESLTIDGSSKATVADNSLATVTATGTATQKINLANNWWGTTSTTAIEALITDHHVNANLPTVTFTPVLTDTPLLPDLVPTFSLSSKTLTAGQTLNATYDLTNSSPSVTEPASTALIQISGGGITKSLAVLDVPALAGNASTGSKTFSFTLPPQTDPFWKTLPGSYTISFIASAQTPAAQRPANSTASLAVTVAKDTTAPAVVFAGFTASPSQALDLLFSENVVGLTAADFTLTDTTTSTTVPSANTVLSYNATDDVAALTFKSTLVAGDYKLTLPAADVKDALGNTMLAAFTYSFVIG